MKKNLLFPGMLLLVSSLTLSSCGEDVAGGSDRKGSIRPVVQLDSGFLGFEMESRAGEDLTADDLSLTVTSTDGSFVRSWDRVTDFDPEEEFPIGDYIIEVAYGDPEVEGFDKKAAYYDSQDIKVFENETTPVSLTAVRTHAMLSIEYTDAFEHYIKTGGVKILSPSGSNIIFQYNDDNPETRSALLIPGQTTIRLDMQRYNGTWVRDIFIKSFVTEARKHYTFTLDVNEGELGNPMLQVLIDDNIEEEVVEVDLSDEVINAPAPEIILEGIGNGETLTVVEGTYDGDPIRTSIVAKGEIASVTLNVTSTYLAQSLWEVGGVDLIQIDEDDQPIYTDKGLECHGIWNQPGRLAVIDFTKVVNCLKYLESDKDIKSNVSKFELNVIDRNGNAPDSENGPVSFSVKVLPIELSLMNPSYLKVGDTEMDIDLSFNGGDPKDKVIFKVRDENGFVEVNADYTKKSDNLYSVHLSKMPTYYDTNKGGVSTIQAEFMKSNGKVKPYSIDVERHGVIAEVTENNIYATKAYVEFTEFINIDPSDIKSPKFELNAKELASTKYNDYVYLISGLESGSDNEITFHFADDKVGCIPLIIRTEVADQLLDSNFDKWSYEQKGNLQYLWTVGDHNVWSTVNTLTTSTSGSGIGSAAIIGGASYKATSGTIPANGRSTKSSSDGGSVGTTTRYDGHTTGDANLHKDKAHTGSNAALIRTVGWGKDNKAKGASALNLKDNAGFSTCEYKTPGELYLGTYSGNKQEYGIKFSSRPSALQFYYRYETVTEGNGDYGSVEVIIYDDSNTIISSNKEELEEYREATYKKVKIPLVYGYNYNKAAKISVKFVSSENVAALKEDTKFWHTPGSNNTSGGEYVGSELYIDDIELIY